MLKPWHHTLTLDKSSGLSIHQQLTQHFRQLITHGEWLGGSALPSSREIAQQLGINRKTVTRVYEELSAQGLIYAEPKRGTFVAENTKHVRTGTPTLTTTPTRMPLNMQQQLGRLIQNTVLPHTRRAALHLHKLQPHEFDEGGLHALRQMLAHLLVYEKRTLVSPAQILCGSGLLLEHALLDCLKSLQSHVLIHHPLSDSIEKKLTKYEIPCLNIPLEVSSRLNSFDESYPQRLIEQIAKYCINYPVTAFWTDSASLPQSLPNTIVATHPTNLHHKFGKTLKDYGLLCIDDQRHLIVQSSDHPPISAYLQEQSMLIGSLYGNVCDMFNLHYLTAPSHLQSRLIHNLALPEQQSMLLNMLAHCELIKRGDYKKLMARVSQMQRTEITSPRP